MESRDKALENAEFVAKDMESRKLRVYFVKSVFRV